MKVVVLLILAASAFGDDLLTSDIVIEDVVANTETFKSVVGCFIDTIPCSELGAQVKAVIPDIVKHGCADCSEDKRHIINVFLTSVKERLPEDYAKLSKKYDPENKYFVTLEAAVAS